MAENIDKVYEDAVASGLLPGISVIAGDKDGKLQQDHHGINYLCYPALANSL
jgi:hypothetical protein